MCVTGVQKPPDRSGVMAQVRDRSRMEQEKKIDSIVASMEWGEVASLIEEAVQVMLADTNPPTAPTSSPPPLHEPQCHEDLYCGSWYSDAGIYDQGQVRHEFKYRYL